MKHFVGFLVLLAGLAFNARLEATPAQVIIIRHAEKPSTGNELNAQGWRRANALVGFFEKNPAVTRYGTPVAIYAMDPGDEDGSERPIQTVTPLAKDLGLAIQHPFPKNDLDKLVKAVLENPDYNQHMVLICWEHHVIPDLVETFGWEDAPKKWPGSVFDQAWVLDFSQDQVVSFQDVPENVLPGDSDADPFQN
jgi:hypothetical protein